MQLSPYTFLAILAAAGLTSCTHGRRSVTPPAGTASVQSVISGPAEITFRWRLPSAAPDASLVLAVDDMELLVEEGSETWRTRRLRLPAGDTTVRWTLQGAGADTCAPALWLENEGSTLPTALAPAADPAADFGKS